MFQMQRRTGCVVSTHDTDRKTSGKTLCTSSVRELCRESTKKRLNSTKRVQQKSSVQVSLLRSHWHHVVRRQHRSVHTRNIRASEHERRMGCDGAHSIQTETVERDRAYNSNPSRTFESEWHAEEASGKRTHGMDDVPNRHSSIGILGGANINNIYKNGHITSSAIRGRPVGVGRSFWQQPHHLEWASSRILRSII